MTIDSRFPAKSQNVAKYPVNENISIFPKIDSQPMNVMLCPVSKLKNPNKFNDKLANIFNY